MAAILATVPEARGILLDRAEVVEASTVLDVPDIVGRCTKIAGDMHVSVPRGGDCYVLKWVMMDRPDDRAVEVLRNCREAMASGGKVLIVDLLLPPGPPLPSTSLFDLRMLYVNGDGGLRDSAEFDKICTSAGLKVIRTIRTRTPNVIIEAIAA